MKHICILLTAVIFTVFQACNPGKIQKKADLSRITDSTYQDTERFEGQQGGGESTINKKPLEYHHARGEWHQGDDHVQFSFNNDSSVVEATTTLLDLPGNWKNYDTLSGVFQHQDSTNQLKLELAVIGSRGKIMDSIHFRQNQNKAIKVPLHELPLTNGNQPPYKAVAIRFTAFPENPPGMLTLKSLALLQKKDTSKKQPVADQFGQRIQGTWDNKIHSLEELKKTAEKQREALAKLDSPAGTDVYGGKRSAGKFEANGHFQVKKDGNTWWMVTPGGNPFWSLGVTCVRPKAATSDVTMVRNREYLFEKLPAKDGRFAEAYSGPHLSLLAWNVMRKYGSLDTWRSRVLKRLPKWGFNTLGSWSHPMFMNQQKMPYTRFISTTGSAADIGNNLPDPFDPVWKHYVDSLFAGEVAPHQSDSLLIGYFVDNELGWNNLELLQADTGAAIRDEWVRFLKLKHGHIRILNMGWESDYKNWEEIKYLKTSDLPDNSVARQDMVDFQGIFADEYFGTIAGKLDEYAPNHLYLGCRYTSSLPPENIVRASGNHLDVVSVNMYSFREKEIRAYHQWTGKPVLISEHHLPLKSERQLEPLYPTFPPQERKTFLLNNAEKLLQMPFCVGLHWYQHADQPVTGRASDGENQVIGLVDITDQPHMPLINGFRQIARNMYQLHRAPDDFSLVKKDE